MEHLIAEGRAWGLTTAADLSEEALTAVLNLASTEVPHGRAHAGLAGLGGICGVCCCLAGARSGSCAWRGSAGRPGLGGGRRARRNGRAREFGARHPRPTLVIICALLACVIAVCGYQLSYGTYLGAAG
jgi:hypothetical protein